jgi:hypothetical protein
MKIKLLLAAIALAGCGTFGHVNQGQVVDYQPAAGRITLVSDSNYRDPGHPRFDVLPAVTIRTPENADNMGPAPDAGKLLALDCGARGAVYFDAATQNLVTVPCSLIAEHRISPNDPRLKHGGFPFVDRANGSIAVYSPRERKLIEFSVPPAFRNLPADTWKFGDEIRYYYKDPGRALRLMNVSKTDLGKK